MARASRPRLIDVARDSRVSPATVSRALAQPDLVKSGTRERVLASAAKLGYAAAPSASVPRLRAPTFGAVVPTLDNATFSHALEAMQARLARSACQLLVATTGYSPAAETEAIRSFLSRGVDGLMLVGASRSPEAIDLLEAARIPIVLTWVADDRFDAVAIDNQAAGRLAARHLAELGHERIGVVTGRLNANDRQQLRIDGIRAELADAGLALPDWRISQQPYTLAGGRAGCTTLLSLAYPPTAIICGIDIQAFGCIVEAHVRGISIPGRLSLVGIDDLEMSAHMSPALTTVHVATTVIGERTADKLVARIEGQSVERCTELPIELVVRQSTGRPA
ncbi:LacI family DNA-binding transcriptional regulator [Pararhizobium mangrovi]|uniref:Substrate-binding domain-containing protein n=1 Tax=Pararhizobium mangrovi TaxID=2590452 RepID=A0A506TXM2_9HYPH|nr:substrate-binding domain-containing protein [Pararhizobium mangrovi]TPW26260.1 substrate-binding domain-containing protein [Pararhizobium mangrovi]